MSTFPLCSLTLAPQSCNANQALLNFCICWFLAPSEKKASYPNEISLQSKDFEARNDPYFCLTSDLFRSHYFAEFTSEGICARDSQLPDSRLSSPSSNSSPLLRSWLLGLSLTQLLGRPQKISEKWPGNSRSLFEFVILDRRCFFGSFTCLLIWQFDLWIS